MKNSTLLKAAAALICVSASLVSRADVFDVYIAAGQSNMDGRGFRNELTGPLAIYNAPQGDTLLWYTNPGESDGSNAYIAEDWITLAPGYSVQPGYSGSLPSTRFGPDVSFGRDMDASTSSRRIAIIKVTRGSTSLEGDWDPSDDINGPKGHMYEGFEEAIPEALLALQAFGGGGHSFEIRGMIWHQGEADSASPISATTEQYQANLTEFIETVREDLGYENLPFLIGDLERHPTLSNRDRTAVRNAQIAVVGAMDFVEFVDSIGIPVQNDENHFTTAGVVELGRRFALTMQSTISNLPGDFNRDGVVNNEDYLVWSTYEGSEIDARADGNNDGVVNELDFYIWQTAVPEPTGAVLISTALIIGIGYGCLRRRGQLCVFNGGYKKSV